MNFAAITEEKQKIGMSYKEYLEMTFNETENSDTDKLEETEKEHFEYKKINLQRIKRLEKQFQPGEDLISAAEKIQRPQLWLLITENWCGDSAQSAPIINKAAELTDKIELRIILRDADKEISDNFYVPGQPRSIPLLIAYDEDNRELFRWGARPKFAAELVKKSKEQGFSKEEYNRELHLWYGRNRGKEIEKEITELINGSYNY